MLWVAVRAFLFATPGCAPLPLRVSYIADEGLLLAGGSSRMPIDSLLCPREPRHEAYAYPSEALLSKMKAEQGLFTGVEAALVTHQRSDHFVPLVVAGFPKGGTQARLIAPPDGVGRLVEEGKAPPESADRIHEIDLDRGESRQVLVNGIGITVYRTRHSQEPPVQSRMYLMVLGSHRPFLEDEAARHASTFENLGLDRREIDIAFLHAW